MKVHLNQIPPEGKHFEGEEPASILQLDEPGIAPTGPLRYSLDVGLSDGGLFATGELSQDFDLECVNCLEAFHYGVRLPAFACQIELTGGETVDLTDELREEIVLALPAHPHCDWNGQKTCAFRAAHPVETVQPVSDGRDAWGALDQLKLK